MKNIFSEIWLSLPPWIWSKLLIIIGLIVIFISLNSLAKSSLKSRK